MADDSCLECCSTFGIIFLAILNVACLVLGIGVMVIGIILQTNDGFLDSDVMNLLDQIDLGGGFTMKDLIELLIIIVICVGVFTIITSLLGGVGALLKQKVLLIIYVIILVICILLELVILAFWIRLLTGVNNEMRSQFESALKNYAGPSATDVYSVGWNAVFILFDCCGVSSITSSANDFETLPTTWWSGGTRGADLVPQSCCSDATKDNYQTYTNTACTQSLSGHYTSGCYDAFDDLLTSLASASIAIIVILVLIEAAAVVFSIVIVYRQSKQTNQVV